MSGRMREADDGDPRDLVRPPLPNGHVKKALFSEPELLERFARGDASALVKLFELSTGADVSSVHTTVERA